MPEIILLGASGYIGQAFQNELRRREWDFVPLARSTVDYTRFDTLLEYLRQSRPRFLINAAGYTGKPNVDACEIARAETLEGNTLFPQTVAHACAVAGIPWGHVSSGCIFSGAHVIHDASSSTERDLMRPEVHALWENDRAVLRGFSEEDEPNFTFRRPPCSFYSGTKALGEEAIRGVGDCFIWRLRIPFDEFDNGRNYLSKLQRYSRLLDAANSISHRADFVRACLDLWEKRAAFGIYNVTNPGWITTRDVVELIQKRLPSSREFHFFRDDADFYATAAKTPRSNCLMDVDKLLRAGVKIRPVEEALEDSLRHWHPEKPTRTSLAPVV
jgi:dTDP-4-dehydrorhamnose reductase